MKNLICFAFTVLLFVLSAEAQTVPANPLVPKKSGGTSSRNLGGGSDLGTSTGVNIDSSKKTVVIQYVTVTPLQDWTNVDGKTVKARILAFSAPPAGEDGPIEVIREGKIRMLIPGNSKPVDYPLAQLTRNHRDEIEQIAKAAAKGPPKPAGEKKKE